MGSHPYKGKGRNDPDVPTKDGAVRSPMDGKVIQYPLPQPSGASDDKGPQPLSRSLENLDNSGAPAERNVEEWRIVSAVLRGEVNEFGTLVRRYQNPIYHLMMRLSGQAVAAEDLTQDAFVRAYEKLGTFKKGKRFFSWLYTIAANIGRDFLRRKGLQNDLFSDQPLDTALPDPDQGDCAKQPDCVVQIGEIGQALYQLPARYSETMLLYYREGMSAKEIGVALQISTAAVKVRIYRGRKMLKQKIGGDYETNA